MRAALLASASLWLAASTLFSQTTSGGTATDTSVELVSVAPEVRRETVRRHLQQVRLELEGRRLPTEGDIVWGSRSVPAGQAVQGPVVVAGGDLHVHGLVRGDAIALTGDVVVHPGGHVSGDAVSAAGRVRLLGGSVDGDRLVLAASLVPRARTAAPAAATARHRMALAVSWLLILLLIGIGTLVFAGNHLDSVVTTLEQDYWRSFLVGLGGQLALLPALLVLVIALVLTIIGILLVPFAVVAFVLATAGMATLGVIAVARVAGNSLTRSPPGLSSRGRSLRSLVVGITVLMGLWILAGGLSWVPVAGWAIRGIAFAVTWVAVSAGLGATILSRAGTRRGAGDGAAVTPVREPSREALAWQTPTPVTGVAAARRPTPVSSRS